MNKQFIKVYVTDDIKSYVETQSELYGMSLSAYVNMCIAQIKQQNEISTSMLELKDMIMDLKTLELSQKFRKQ